MRAGRRGGAERSGEAADAQDGRCCSGGGGGATGGGGGAPEPVGAGGAGRCGHPRVPQLRGPVAAAGGARPVWLCFTLCADRLYLQKIFKNKQTFFSKILIPVESVL